MKTFEVYFEIYGKKLKTSVSAESESQAKEFIRNEIIFHKVNEVYGCEAATKYAKDLREMDKTLKGMMDFLGGFKK